MRRAVGVEVTATSVRAVRPSWRPRGDASTVEVPWDPRHPDEAVAELARALGAPAGVRIAVGPAFLGVKHVQLPPASPDTKARMIALAPERHFAAATQPLVTSFSADADVAFAGERVLIQRWIEAFGNWAPVERIEPSPVTIARALRHAPPGEHLDADDGVQMLVRHERGRLRAVRILAPAPAPRGEAAPDSRFAAARGALAAADVPPHQLLAPPEWTATWRRGQRRRLAASLVAAGIGVAVLLTGADRSRQQVLVRLNERTAALAAQASPASQALRTLQSLQAELALVRDRGASSDRLGALAALGGALPEDAVLRSARATGDDWQVDGTTSSAAAIVPRLDRAARFDSVRVLAASSRFREGNKSLETFSIAFRYRPQP